VKFLVELGQKLAKSDSSSGLIEVLKTGMKHKVTGGIAEVKLRISLTSSMIFIEKSLLKNMST
jgi:hypothetical protein